MGTIVLRRLKTVALAAATVAAAWLATTFASPPALPTAAANGAPARDADFPAELVEFAPSAKNPVFQGAGPGHWDVKIRERGWILVEPEGYRLWYTGYDGTPNGIRRLGLATSPDGLHWQRASDEPTLADHWVEDMMVVRHEGRYYMFAEGLNDQAQLLTSADGVEWTREGRLDVRYVDGRPLSAGPYGTPTAWHEDGTWWLMYERQDAGVWLASSTDLKVWTNLQDEPVLRPGPGANDRLMIAVNQVVRRGGKYYAYYHGTGSETKPRQWTTNIAVSEDRIHWRKYPGNPLLQDNRSSGILVHDGERFRLYAMHEQVSVQIGSRPAEE